MRIGSWSTRQHLLKPDKLVWLLMVVLHGPPLVSALRELMDGAGSPTACLGLALSMLLFVLKLWDVSWLRIHTDARSWAAIFVALGLIHADCLAGSQATAVLPEGTEVVAGVLLATALPVVRRQCGRLAGAAANRIRRPVSARPSAGAASLLPGRPHDWLLSSFVFLLRAPPA